MSKLLCIEPLEPITPLKRYAELEIGNIRKKRAPEPVVLNIVKPPPRYNFVITGYSPKYGIALGPHLGNNNEDNEYADELLDNFFANEKKNRPLQPFAEDPLSLQNKFRRIAILYLVKAAREHFLESVTLFLAIHTFERFYSLRPDFPRNIMNYVASCCLVMAAKMEEVRRVDVKDLIDLRDFKHFSGMSFVEMEAVIFKTLSYNMVFATPVHFWTYWRVSFITHLDIVDLSDDFSMLVNYLYHIAVIDNACAVSNYNYSLLVASSAYLAYFMLHGGTNWPKSLQTLTGYQEGELLECVADLWIHQIISKHRYETTNPDYLHNILERRFKGRTDFEHHTTKRDMPPCIKEIVFKKMYSSQPYTNIQA